MTSDLGLEQQRLARLSAREAEVLAALMEGKTAAQISAEFGRSLPTVRGHVRAILSKLEVGSQLAAVSLAYRCGWAPPPRNSQF